MNDARRRLNWLWPALPMLLVVAFFCLPLFAGLGGLDVRGDEAAHSFSVDRILESGDWLVPKSSPFEDTPFLEKPPLKFWIVAAGIRSGLLPHTEFGLRFWDALFSSVAFFYIFLIGRRLAGPLCGATAVLILFIHRPLLFEHGLRGNNMEAALLLGYCGGMYHYLAWASSEQIPQRRRHTIAVALYFALGFMVKFIAVLFLPVVLAVASLALPACRTRLVRDWRLWGVAKLIALALVTPWFAYASYKFGVEFWHVIFGNQVYERLTVGLDPSHVHSASHYFARLYESLNYSGVFVLVAAGGLVLLVDTIRRRSTEGVVVLLWFALPFGAISLLASKLYYYADSFLPPVGLAGGCLMAFFWRQLGPVVCRFIEEMDQRVTTWVPGLIAARRQVVVRRLLLGIATAAGVITVWTLAFGPVHISMANVRVLKSGGFLRPWLIAAVCGVLGGSAKQVGRFLGVPLLMLVMLPVPAYRETLARLVVQKHPMRTALTCVEGVRSEGAGGMAWHGLYIAGPDSAYDHGHIYYFRRLRPWDRAQEPPDATLYTYLYEPSEQRLILMDDSGYTAFKQRLAAGAIPSAREPRVEPGMVKLDNALLLLPGAYAACRDVAPESAPR